MVSKKLKEIVTSNLSQCAENAYSERYAWEKVRRLTCLVCMKNSPIGIRLIHNFIQLHLFEGGPVYSSLSVARVQSIQAHILYPYEDMYKAAPPLQVSSSDRHRSFVIARRLRIASASLRSRNFFTFIFILLSAMMFASVSLFMDFQNSSCYIFIITYLCLYMFMIVYRIWYGSIICLVPTSS